MAKQEQSKFSQIEQEILEIWEREKTFEASLTQRKGKPVFSFYDGPPFANGLPHYGHVLAMTIKDSVTRYKTMRGYYVPRRLGWDTHGLPVEYEVEKELKISGKQQIKEMGIAQFNQACHDSVFRYKDEWHKLIKRMGRWADFEDDYATLDEEYIESIWWVFKSIWDKDLVYQSHKSMPYCPRCATPLSNFELNQGYQDDVEDPSLFVKFKLKDEPAQLVAWTTTPWTLPGNAALGVDSNVTYVRVQYTNDEGETEELIFAKDRLEVIDSDYHVLGELKGSELVGKSYEPLFELELDKFESNDNLYKIWAADFVSLEEGSGIVHIAPAFGEDDLTLGQRNDVPILATIDEFGQVRAGIGLDTWAGLGFKEADRPLIEHLSENGAVFAAETISHTYPFCWRCETPLLYYAVTTWFIAVTRLQQQLVDNNQQINWIPAHIRDGRFGHWLEEARDWGVSRNRFWGAPLPVWQCLEGHNTVVGSIAELKKLAVDPKKVSDLHRPGIDAVKVKCSDCGVAAERVEEVFDCWFESGAMPYAQDHYPFENKATLKKKFPAEFIAEGIDQTRGWFYTLHVLATLLFDQPAFKNCVVNGLVMAADGKKLSKRLRNYPEPQQIFSELGVDSLRYFLLSSPVVRGENVRFSYDHVREVNRNLFNTLANVSSFFKMYADIDNYQPPSSWAEPKSKNVLDQWILSRLNQTIGEVTTNADEYLLDKATRPIREFVDDLSNWYVRRSRRRFWKSEDDSDKKAAYATLRYVLLRTTQLLAPWAPFMSEKIYRELRGEKLPASVHLTDWPQAKQPDEALLLEMKQAREYITQGLQQRASAGIKVRQPLSKATVPKLGNPALGDIIKEELNVKTLVWAKKSAGSAAAVRLDTKITAELKREGLMRDVVRQIQQFRKTSGLAVEDRIKLGLATTDKELGKAIKEHAATITEETLALDLREQADLKHATTVKIGAAGLEIALEKASEND